MAVASDDETIDGKFVDDDLGVRDFDGPHVAVQVGGGSGAGGMMGTGGILDDLRTQMTRMRERIERALRIEVRANTTEQLCRVGASGQGDVVVPDPGVRVVLPGTKPGEGTTIIPPPQPAPKPGSSGDGSSMAPGGQLDEGNVIYYARGTQLFQHHGLDTIIRMSKDKPPPQGSSHHESAHASGYPVMLVHDLRNAASCMTFGPTPTVVISPPIGFNINFTVQVSTVLVAVAFELSITPVSASFARRGLCWQGICDGKRETLEGTVYCSVKTHFSVRANGQISFGPIKIGGVSGAFSTNLELSRPLDFKLEA